MLNYLRTPYPALASDSARWRLCILFSLFVFAFLLVFQPFGIGESETLLKLSVGYGLTCFAIMAVLNLAVKRLLPGFFNEEKWTTGKELLWSFINVAAIGLGNAAYTSFIFNSAFTLNIIFVFEFYTLAVAVLPVSISILVKRLTLEKRYEKESEVLNNNIITIPKDEAGKNQVEILIRSENPKENLSVHTNDLLFIRGADNYAEVFYWKSGTVKKNLLRTTLKKIPEDLPPGNPLFRCHKSYLVNMSHVKHVSGNAQGLKLHLQGTDELIPVSRNLTETVKQQLSVRP